MCGLIDCCRNFTVAVRRRAMMCRLLMFFFIYVTVMTLRFVMVADPTELHELRVNDDADDHKTPTKRLTPSTLDAVDLPGRLSTTSDSNDSVSIVHVVWFFPPRSPLRFHQALALMAVQRYARPRKILLWYDAASTPPAGRWWQFARQSVAHLLPVPYERPTSVFNRTLSVPEHQSDVARLAILEEHGGLYIDLDVIVVRPLDSLLHHDVVLGAETPDLLGSGLILARRPGTEFIRRWRQSYADKFDDGRWNEHACRVPMMLARRYPDIVHVEWFSMHRPNWDERRWLYTDGRLWDWSGNYAVHLWFRTHPTDVVYDPVSIRNLNTTTGEVLRHIYYGDTRLLPPVAPVPPNTTGFNQTTT